MSISSGLNKIYNSVYRCFFGEVVIDTVFAEEDVDTIFTEEDIDTVNTKDIDTKKSYNWSSFDYPVDSFFGNECSWRFKEVVVPTFSDNSLDTPWKYPRDIFSSENTEEWFKELLDYNKFEEIYYFQEGDNDGDAWIFLVKHQNGLYVYFNASCDFTGFDCCGSGEILYSKNKRMMWQFGITEEIRENMSYKNI